MAIPSEHNIFDWRTDWQWLLALAFLVLLTSNTLWHGPILIIMAIGVAQLLRGRIVMRGPDGAGNRLHLLLFGLFWIPMVLSLMSAVQFDHSAGTTMKYVRFVGFGFGMLFLLADSRARQRLSWAVFAIVALWCADALWQAASGSNVLGYPRNPWRLQGVFYPRFRLGVVLALFSPLWFECFRLLAHRYGAWWQVGLFAVLALVLPTVILLTGSRSAWLMLLGGGVLYALWLWVLAHRRSRGAVVALVVGGILALALAAATTNDGFRTRVGATLNVFSADFEQADEATAYRLSIWKPAVAMVEANPLTGIGPRGYRYAFSQYAKDDNFWLKREERGATHPHAQWLEVATETGGVGFAGLVCVFALMIAAGRRALRQDDSFGLMWTFAILLALWPTNVHSAVYSGFWSSIIWWCAAIAIAMTTPTQSDKAA
jgi:O-antigen ligase